MLGRIHALVTESFADRDQRLAERERDLVQRELALKQREDAVLGRETRCADRELELARREATPPPPPTPGVQGVALTRGICVRCHTNPCGRKGPCFFPDTSDVHHHNCSVCHLQYKHDRRAGRKP